MPGVSNSGGSASAFESELYFLISRFLSAGPCKNAAEVLKRELEENKLLPKRTDWEGGEHPRSFDNLVQINHHISSDHLLKICQRIGPILDKEVKPSVQGVSSLLGAGRQSLLRTAKECATATWAGQITAVSRHQRPLMPPVHRVKPPNKVHVLTSRQMNGVGRKHDTITNNTYKQFIMYVRFLGHLSAVYCVTFDRTGLHIITGADDHLVKIWSATDGRLLATLRGAGGEITDMAVNYENTLLAAGSCDKMIRVWSLRTMAPVAVLHGHTGSITSLQFCPQGRGDHRYLASTGMDGCMCFWQWNASNHVFNPKPTKFIERSRAGAQMLCASFSPGGVFLATGSTDHVLRIYCFSGATPEKICELESHTDCVDSIQYSNHGNIFVSGSKDGTARIWRYERQEWRAIVLNMSTKLPGEVTSIMDGNKFNKLMVTMVSWNEDDRFVITAVTDCTLKVWDSHTGQLRHVLTGHEDEVYVLEHNPTDPRLILSAGHDGHVVLWDVVAGTMIKKFLNNINGQGHGSVFDCKFSPDGMSFAATDSHGHTLIFGFGTNDKYKKIPSEVFFHTDYRPLIRDANSHVLDEQTQQPPHLMPPPFLVDIDGNPHPPRYQRLVPGREECEKAQLIPQVGTTPSGDREVLDDHNFPGPNDEAEPSGAGPSDGAGPSTSQQGAAGPSTSQQEVAGPAPDGPDPSAHPAAEEEEIDVEDEEERHGLLDALIHRMQREQDGLGPDFEEPLRSPRQRAAPISPRGRLSRSGEEGVRQLSGNVPVSQRATKHDIAKWRKRVVVKELERALAKFNEKLRRQMAEEELKCFVVERKKKPLPIDRTDSSDSGSQMRTRTQRTRKRQNHGYRTRSARQDNHEETGRNRLTTRALYDTEEEEEDDSGREETDDHLWNDSSDGESSEYSDWAADGGVDLQPPKRSSRPSKKKKVSSSEEEEEKGSQAGTSADTRSKKKKKPPPKKKKKQQKLLENINQNNMLELPEEFRPSEWLTDTIPRKAPYVPQMGDEVIYFRQGHELYVRAVKNHKVYDIDPNKNQPWHKISNLREQELVKIVGIKYEIRPPRLCCLKLAYIDPECSKMTGGTFTIKYHDMPDVIDFLVLRQTYDTAMRRHWKVGDRFRSMIDDAWWLGKIEAQEPFQVEFPDSQFQCFYVAWDNGEYEKMSPWDLEPIDPERIPERQGGSIDVTPEELKSVMYTPIPNEWPAGGRDIDNDRCARGFEQIMELRIAEHFLAPVDLNLYPAYARVVAYPMDLNTIKERLHNRYYRRVNSIQWDVRHIESNAEKFNEPRSQIVKFAHIITDLCLKFIADPRLDDPMPLYYDLTLEVNLGGGDQNVDVEASNDEDESQPGQKRKKNGASQPAKRQRQDSDRPDPNAWKTECLNLLQAMLTSRDSEPFRAPVDPLEYPDYSEVVDHPMDLHTVKEQLECGVYDNPPEYARDIRLIFHNSKAYNTNKRSRIVVMTLRLSAMFEDQFKDILQEWKTAVKGKRTKNLDTKKRSTKSSSRGGGGGDGPSSRSGQGSSSSKAQPGTSTLSPFTGRATRSQGTTTATTNTPTATTTPSARVETATPMTKAPPASRAAHIPKGSTRSSSRTAAKRPKVESGDDSDTDDSDTEEEDVTPKKKRPPPKKSAKKGKGSVTNGVSKAYVTRRATGSLKPKKYDDDTEVEEDDNDDDNEKKKSSSSSGSSSSSSSSTGSSSSSESGTDNSSKEESEDEGERTRRSKRTTTQQSSKATRSTLVQRRTPSKEPKKTNNEDEDDDDDDGEEEEDNNDHDYAFRDRRSAVERAAIERSNRRMRTRNQGRQRIQYREETDGANATESDNGTTDDEDNDDDDDDDLPFTASVSARGRVRKLTPRARASLLQ